MGKIEDRVNKELKQKKELLEDKVMEAFLKSLKYYRQQFEDSKGAIRTWEKRIEMLEAGKYKANDDLKTMEIDGRRFPDYP